MDDLPTDDTGPIKRWIVSNFEQILKM
jgi:hypothetical protein